MAYHRMTPLRDSVIALSLMLIALCSFGILYASLKIARTLRLTSEQLLDDSFAAERLNDAAAPWHEASTPEWLQDFAAEYLQDYAARWLQDFAAEWFEDLAAERLDLLNEAWLNLLTAEEASPAQITTAPPGIASNSSAAPSQQQHVSGRSGAKKRSPADRTNPELVSGREVTKKPALPPTETDALPPSREAVRRAHAHKTDRSSLVNSGGGYRPARRRTVIRRKLLKLLCGRKELRWTFELSTALTLQDVIRHRRHRRRRSWEQDFSG